jgi:hypothetical protein
MSTPRVSCDGLCARRSAAIVAAGDNASTHGRFTMSEQQHDPSTGDEPTTTGTPGSADETFGWTDEGGSANGGDARATAERMLGQLQTMIDQIATQAGPVVRQIGAKAAELAAVAADRAGPLAHRAADATADASVKLAERSRTLAADLRSRASGHGDGAGEQSTAQPDVDQGGSAMADLGGADDATERSRGDDPAEGRQL